MRVVLDTNVLVAAFAARGLCRAVLEVSLAGAEIITSPRLLNEMGRALRDKVKMPAPLVADRAAFIRTHARVVRATRVDRSACRDPDDLEVLGAAVSGGAEFIVTGDSDLLILKEFQGTRLVTPRQFWEHLQQRGR